VRYIYIYILVRFLSQFTLFNIHPLDTKALERSLSNPDHRPTPTSNRPKSSGGTSNKVARGEGVATRESRDLSSTKSQSTSSKTPNNPNLHQSSPSNPNHNNHHHTESTNPFASSSPSNATKSYSESQLQPTGRQQRPNSSHHDPYCFYFIILLFLFYNVVFIVFIVFVVFVVFIVVVVVVVVVVDFLLIINIY
jgi:hypothetical protein